MLVESYRKEFVLPPNPKARHLRCYAHLDGNIGELLPYLNTVLGGYQYYKEPPMLTLKFQAKLITLYPQMIAINMVMDEAEADSILEWLRQEINDTWKKREEIKPSFEAAAKPKILDILKLLPKDNCQECGLPTCLVFAVRVSEGSKGYDDCPKLDPQSRSKLKQYLARIFHELLSRDREDGRATGQPQGVGSEAYLNGTSRGTAPEDARKDGHIRGRSR